MVSDAHRVVVSRDAESGWWLASVIDVQGAHTEAETLEGLDRAVREAVALMLDLPYGRDAEDALDLVWELHTGEEFDPQGGSSWPGPRKE